MTGTFRYKSSSSFTNILRVPLNTVLSKNQLD